MVEYVPESDLMWVLLFVYISQIINLNIFSRKRNKEKAITDNKKSILLTNIYV